MLLVFERLPFGGIPDGICSLWPPPDL